MPPLPRPSPSSRNRFRPRLETLDDRATPAIAFGAEQSVAVGASPRAVAAGDFNGDGRLDAVVAEFGTLFGTPFPTGSTVSVLTNATPFGTATPVLGALQAIPVGVGPSALAVGDVNGDGRPDIVVTEYQPGTVSVLLNATPAGAAAPAFAARQSFAVGFFPLGVALGDFDGDGRTDLAVAVYNTNSVSVFLNRTESAAAVAFAPRQQFDVWNPSGGGPTSVAVADFNDDGRPDLVTADYSEGNGSTVSVLRNTTAAGDAAVSFAGPRAVPVGWGPYTVAVGDFNNDGMPDLAAANTKAATVSVLMNVSAVDHPVSAFTRQQLFDVGAGPYAMAVADFNGDGRTDIATAAVDGGTVSVLENTAAFDADTFSFAPHQTFAAGTGAFVATAADFNGDGRADLLTADYGWGSGTTVAVRANTTAAFAPAPAQVGQFGDTGVWGYYPAAGTWTRLTGANADALAAAPNGHVIASFGGHGVWYYRPSAGWVRIHELPAVAVAIDPLGVAYASFAGYGTHTYRPAGAGSWVRLTTSVAHLLAAGANGNVAMSFPESGVYRYRARFTGGWTHLTGVPALALAIGEHGEIAASFTGYATYRHKAGAWSMINGVVATALAVAPNGSVAASLGTFGVARYVPHTGGWQSLHNGAQAPALATDRYGNVFASLAWYGVYEFDLSASWRLRRSAVADILGLR